jgi:hypothetical protein
MVKANNKAQLIKQEMSECFKQLGFPDLGKHSSIILSEEDSTGHIVMGGLRFQYDEDYYSRAVVDMVINEEIPSDKVAPLKELLNRINTDLGCSHYCIIPETKKLVYRTSLFVPGDRFPRNKFKKLLSQFFADYCRLIPLIAKLLAEGGNPEEIITLLGPNVSAAPKENNPHGKTDYRRLGEGIKRVLAEFGLSVKDETITDSSAFVMNRFLDETGRYVLIAFSLNDTGQLYLQMFSPDEVPERVISEAAELANMFNSISYVNHILIQPERNFVSLFTGVILDPVLDEDELKYQLMILISEGCKYLPLFYGNHPVNTNPKEHLKALMAGCCVK